MSRYLRPPTRLCLSGTWRTTPGESTGAATARGGRGRTASERASGGGRGAGEGRGEDGGARAGPRPRHRPLLALRERGRAPGRTAALPACEAARSGPFLPACSWLVQSGGPDVCFSLIRRPRSTGCTPPLLGRNFLLLKEKRLPGGAALAGDPSARGDRGGSIGASSRSARDAEEPLSTKSENRKRC